MFIPNTHKASRFWIVPDCPYFKKVHFVIRGNTFDIGSIRFSWSIPENLSTYDKWINQYFEKRFLGWIFEITNEYLNFYLKLMRTSIPYVENSYPRNLSVRKIWIITLIKLRHSHKKKFRAHELCSRLYSRLQKK